ncbi:T9SS type A sorting domain-containing protein [Flammeovirgaceae bacterium SG7u.111]|nr:T9SS type A sorting domain-containing protein [Flammeovirgaceae bacterium SG7u.132]WPO37525.1 T9SS type A sorting domain-containing protein [Flammeovirgaceae bacterium SG7u.111]
MNLYKTILTAALMFGITVAIAKPFNPKGGGEFNVESEKLSYSIYAVVNTTKVRIAYEKQDTEPIAIEIYNDSGKLLYAEKLKNASSMKKSYDLEDSGAGNYKVKITTGAYTASHYIELGAREQEEFVAKVSPVLEKKLRVAYEFARGPVLIVVEDEDSKSVFRELINARNYTTLYNINKLEKGNYTVRLSCGDQLKEHAFKL